MCGVLLDKYYLGLLEAVRAIHPTKFLHTGQLTRQDLRDNGKVSSDLVIAEN